MSVAIKQVAAKPFVKWVGGKRALLPELIKRQPKTFGRYYEPFLGGGALFFALQPKDAVLSDLNEELINAYICLKSCPDLVKQLLASHVYEKDYYYAIRAMDRDPGWDKTSAAVCAARFIYLQKTCFNGLYRVNKKGQFNSPFGRYKNPTILDKTGIDACTEALKGVKLMSCGYESILETVRQDDFVYLDPPYAPVSATANFTGYTAQEFGSQQQVELRDFCRELNNHGVKFMLSNSSAPLILDLYKEFYVEIVQAPRAVNSKASKRGLVDEVLVRNYGNS